MKNSTVEKLKMIMEDGEITKGKIGFITRVMGDENCPILFESNVNFIRKELETETMKINTNVIKKEVTVIHGDVEYGDINITSYGNFMQLNQSPVRITHSGIVYIEEYKLIKNRKNILDKKILIFSCRDLESSIDKELIDREDYISQNIRLRDKKAFSYKYVVL